MRRIFLALLILTAGIANAEAVTDCGVGYATSPKIQPAYEAFRYFRDLGLKTLLKQVDAGEILVTAKRKSFAQQADVSARITLRGQKKIVVRAADLSTPTARQEFRWDVAMTLFELQMQPAIWSRRALAPDDMAIDLKGLAYSIPSAWRDQQQAQTADLIHELYTLFDHLAAPSNEDIGSEGLKAEDFMPKFDPGYNWGLRMLWLKDASQSIGPNVTDYLRWKSGGGRVATDSILRSRHDKSVFFNYYMNHFKRMLMVTSIASTLAMAPRIFEIPSYIEAHRSTVAEQTSLHQAPARAAVTGAADSDYRIRNDIERETKALTELEQAPVRDDARIEQLKAQVQQLIDDHPALYYSGAVP
jgi:hypothetical protein